MRALRLLRWTAPFLIALAVLCAGVTPAPAQAMPVPPSRLGTSADYQGFINGRFLILNMHGGFIHRSIDPVQENIRYAAWMNAGAIRIFATDSTQNSAEDANWLGNRIADVAPALRANDVKLIVALVNNHEEVPGEPRNSVGMKDGYWQHLLPFFQGNWRGPYLDFSRRLISTVVSRGARDVILAWEYGNELNTQDDPPLVLTFFEQMRREIRAIDPTTPIWPGTMGSHHLTPAWEYSLARRLYCEGPIDAYTLHTYDWVDAYHPGDMPIDRDLNYVVNYPCENGRKLPVVVEELGTSRELPGSYTADNESARIEQEINQLRMVLSYDQVVGVGAWSAESPNTPIFRHDNRRGLTSYGPGRDGSGSCYPGAPDGYGGARCRLEQILRNLPSRP
ncbi:MAG: hypothetical protein IT306_15555 [Chloroflexi bacterium]|nr:hypothetical protein [Chloroflexota bacterium]